MIFPNVVSSTMTKMARVEYRQRISLASGISITSPNLPTVKAMVPNTQSGASFIT